MIPVLIVVFLLAVGLTAFWIWALVDCASKEPAKYSGKIVWIVVIALFHWLGALAYLIIRRPRRMAEARQGIIST